MVSNKDINWIYAQLQSRYKDAMSMEKSILGEVLELFEEAPEFQIVMTLNDASDEELRQLIEGARHECVILPGGTEASIELMKPEQKWIPVTERLPETNDFVLVLVSGHYENLWLDQAIEFATYNKEEGWILEMWPEWDNPNVTYWMQVPERPEV